MEEELSREPQLLLHVTEVALARVTARLNSRIRTDGLSAREIFFQRDQFTNNQIEFSDRSVINAKHNRAVKNNVYSADSKAHGKPPRPAQNINIGDLVYLYSERDKHLGRSRYLVISVEGEWCSVRKFANTTISSSAYRVKLNEVYKVPTTTLEVLPKRQPLVEDDDDAELSLTPPTPSPATTPTPASSAPRHSSPDQLPNTPHNDTVELVRHPEPSIDCPIVSPPTSSPVSPHHQETAIPTEICSPLPPSTQPEETDQLRETDNVMTTRSGRRITKPERFRSGDFIY